MKIDHTNPFATQMASYVQSGVQAGTDGTEAGTSFGDALAQAAAQMAAQITDSSAAAPSKTKEDTTAKEDEPTLIERIREKGFVAFVDDLQEEKLKELRKKILEAMGYSEEDLSAMSPEQRAQVEKIVDNEIIKRMAASAALKSQGKDQNQHTVGIVHKAELSVRTTTVSMQATTIQSGVQGGGLLQGQMGLGPLLAHQEIAEDRKSETERQTENMSGKKDRAELV